MADDAAVEIVGLSKSYGGVPAVRRLDLRARRGEIHGLLGPNGAGKTTVLRALLDLVRPDGGSIRLLGGPAGTAAGAARGGVAGFVDMPRFYPYLSGRRNLSLLAQLDDDAGDPDRVEQVLEQVDLGRDADRKVSGYSTGMRQRLGLASALLRSPKLLVLDEPTSSLDPAGARDVREQIRRLAQDGVAVLLSSHDMSEVEQLCSALTIIHRGEVVFSGTIEKLREKMPAAVHAMTTSNDERAREIAATEKDVDAAIAPDGGGLVVAASEADLDRYVIALGRAGIAVRSLESRDHSLEALFLRLTEGEARREEPHPTPPDSGTRAASSPARRRGFVRGALLVTRVEIAKLAAQVKAWATLGACIVGPFAFVAALELQSTLPDDTLFGRWCKTSGFAVPLVVLGFAASWALPVVVSIAGGDLFASEDRHGTWPTLLTRSRSRAEIFVGKVVAALGFSLAAVCAMALASIAAGTLVIGRQPLLGLSGTLLAPDRSMLLVAAAWGSAIAPAFGFTALALLASVATRSTAAGIGLPVLAAFAMQLYAFVDGPDAARRAMLTTPFGAWHGLFTEPPFHAPLVEGTALSALYFAVCVGVAYTLFRRRELGS